MTINLVVAASENNVIGKNNQLLWSLPNDMKFFKNTTWAMPVIMGRKTFQSMGKALNGRTNIVITSKADFTAPGIIVVNSLEAAIEAARQTDALEAYIIGGGEIYRQSLPLCHRVYLTRVHTTIDGDTFFPVLPPAEWMLHSVLHFPADDKHAYAYSFEVWDKNPQ
ncbi:dihydrofolate reductase [Flavihumibacter fluvii]|uniref:dihydrofolate reductase n=1 Tax=Flavihumibacter fluvii TaxID=2838157 RepID=UPI001BDE3A1E|nr:dihydrofolate reductase [Flavihumibacter fluvii]ULQ53096.1 dihydrofolate reductase [Flavihumibacter fluvii]